MPLVRVDLLRGTSAAHRAAIVDGVHRALAATFEVPEADRFAILTEHDPESFRFDRSYLGVERSESLVILHITASRTRGVAQKKALYAALARNLAEDPGLRPEDILVVLAENGREDWSFGRGIASYVA